VFPPRMPAVDATFTMQPDPAAIMSGRNVLQVRKVPLRLVSSSRSQSSAASSVTRCSKKAPATLTSRPAGPWAAVTLACSDRTSASLRTSQRWSAPSEMSAPATLYPSSTSLRATAAPIVPAAPVTTATLLTAARRSIA
jgi:hypothetical protein